VKRDDRNVEWADYGSTMPCESLDPAPACFTVVLDNDIGSQSRLAPRIGLAYRPSEKNVLRAGYGIANSPLPFGRTHGFGVWDEYQAALRDRRFNQLQELELQCDAIAVITLVGLGLDPSLLIASLKKLTRFNQRIGASANAHAYVSIEDRTRFIQAMIEMVRGRMK